MSVLAFLGGTGPLGRGLALRLALAGHEVVLGSRDAARGAALAAELRGDREVALSGTANAEAVAAAETVFLCFPYEAQAPALRALAAPLDGKLVVDVVNPMGFDEHGPFMLEVAAGSAAEEARDLLPGSRIVSAFHDVSARLLLDTRREVATDVLICGDDAGAKLEVMDLAVAIPGIRGVDAGPLRMSRQLEGLTAILLEINSRYKVRSGVRVSGLTDERLHERRGG